MSTQTAMTAATVPARASGGYVPRTMPAAAVTEHLRELSALGATVRGIADAAGLTPSIVSRHLAGRQARIRPATAHALLRVSIDEVMTRPLPSGFVPAVGARRRITALLALGWRHADITAHADGIQSAVILHQVGDLIARSTHDTIARAYDQLSMTPGPSDRTRTRARAAGYAPPLAWDDDTIDHADARLEQTYGRSAASRASHRLEDLLEDAAWMAAAGVGLTEAARRLQLAPDSLARQLHRAARHDLASKLRRQEGGVPAPTDSMDNCPIRWR